MTSVDATPADFCRGSVIMNSTDKMVANDRFRSVTFRFRFTHSSSRRMQPQGSRALIRCTNFFHEITREYVSFIFTFALVRAGHIFQIYSRNSPSRETSALLGPLRILRAILLNPFSLFSCTGYSKCNNTAILEFEYNARLLKTLKHLFHRAVDA